MWGYSCGTVAPVGATCAKLNPNAPAGTGWSPVVITVPYATTGTNLTINLTNSLTFNGNNVPTSLVIVGQLGGGLGTVGSSCAAGATCTTSPDHTLRSQPPRGPSSAAQWRPELRRLRGRACSRSPPRLRVGTTATGLTWSNLKPGTYLIESGTHPSIQGPMGLYGILVVTTAPVAGNAGMRLSRCDHMRRALTTPKIPLLLSEIDPVQNNAVQHRRQYATGFSETMVWSGPAGRLRQSRARRLSITAIRRR